MERHHARHGGLSFPAAPRQFRRRPDRPPGTVRVQRPGPQDRLVSATCPRRPAHGQDAAAAGAAGVAAVSSYSTPWILESSDEPTSTGVPHGKLGMWVFLASGVMLFGSLIRDRKRTRLKSS